MSRKSRKIVVQEFFSRSKQSDEKIARDMIRMELMAMCRLAAAGQVQFGQDLLARANTSQKGAMKRELRRIADMLETMACAEDDA